MRVPNSNSAFISPAKARDYLLSPQNTAGREKARFFGALGFRQHDDGAFAVAARRILGNPVDSMEETEYGSKYRVIGILTGPSGRHCAVATIWMNRRGEDFPRLVTVYPEGS